jgi:hypothetical protein
MGSRRNGEIGTTGTERRERLSDLSNPRRCAWVSGRSGEVVGVSGEVAGVSSLIRPKPGLGRFGLDRSTADGLVIGVGFGDCYGLELIVFFVLIV